MENQNAAFEASTLTYAFLKEFDPQISEHYAEQAFQHQQTKENAETITNSLPPNFFHNLLVTSLPKTNYPSLIHNSTVFPQKCTNVSQRRLNLIYNCLKRIALTHRIIGHTRLVQHILIDPNGTFFITGSDDSNIKVWHIPSLTLMHTLKGHIDAISGLSMSPDKKLLASFGKEDHCVRLWSLEDGFAVSVLPNPNLGSINSVAFSPCGRYLAIATSFGSLRIYNVSKLPDVLSNVQSVISNELSQYECNSLVNDIFSSCEKVTYFPDIDTHKFISSPPKLKKPLQLKGGVLHFSFSPGGNFGVASQDTGSITVVHIPSNHKWTVRAHNAPVDYACFMKYSFNHIFSWSSKGGDIKIWQLKDKIQCVSTFSVRVNVSRRYIIGVSLGCTENILCAITSQSLFCWKIEDTTPMIHVEDNIYMKELEKIESHPFLPSVFLVVSKSYITIWDIYKSSEPLHTLIIPVETPRIHDAHWTSDGLSIISSDATGGIFIFRIADGPECRITPQFFPTDFTVSEWIEGKGQIEESTRKPTALNDRSLLTDADKVVIFMNYKPMSLAELKMKAIIPPKLKYAFVNEEVWIKKNKEDRELAAQNRYLAKSSKSDLESEDNNSTQDSQWQEDSQ
ncbi:WD40 repeat domain-containing protein [Histomonas meleagridis]|uniref:WD40 repeat domain-containing protein n=1 Tax=Histomonas meleagridis TaxID=135588 RepID=UPI003559CE04|nr:WD40 repeat domain-containing protein [Histomonas meleagridis]KAH0797771.1 WD40 repeat domain-containing protein [Histomonas meleagridis]